MRPFQIFLCYQRELEYILVSDCLPVSCASGTNQLDLGSDHRAVQSCVEIVGPLRRHGSRHQPCQGLPEHRQVELTRLAEVRCKQDVRELRKEVYGLVGSCDQHRAKSHVKRGLPKWLRQKRAHVDYTTPTAAPLRGHGRQINRQNQSTNKIKIRFFF